MRSTTPATSRNIGAGGRPGRGPHAILSSETLTKPEEPRTSLRAAPRRLKPAALYQRFCWAFPVLAAALLCAGCAHIPNQWQEDGPAAGAKLDSPTSADLYARYQPAEARRRDWDAAVVGAESGAVTHWPLYFEDPFEDKGAGRGDYRLGWEDYVALPYCFARHTLNWLLFPASAVVTPAWTLMESDGVLSEQALGYDHDAARAERRVPEAPPAAQDQAAEPPATSEAGT